MSSYTLQVDLITDGKVISSGEIVCEGTSFFPININYRYYVLQGTKYINTIAYLRTTINWNFNRIFYYSKDIVPTCLRSISHNDYNNFSTRNIPMKEHDNIINEYNKIESIEFEI